MTDLRNPDGSIFILISTIVDSTGTFIVFEG